MNLTSFKNLFVFPPVAMILNWCTIAVIVFFHIGLQKNFTVIIEHKVQSCTINALALGSAHLIYLSNSIVHLLCLLSTSILSVFECTACVILALSTYCFAISNESCLCRRKSSEYKEGILFFHMHCLVI